MKNMNENIYKSTTTKSKQINKHLQYLLDLVYGQTENIVALPVNLVGFAIDAKVDRQSLKLNIILTQMCFWYSTKCQYRPINHHRIYLTNTQHNKTALLNKNMQLHTVDDAIY